MELQFEAGFPSSDSLDGSGFPNAVHVNHPNFDFFHESIYPAEHELDRSNTREDKSIAFANTYYTALRNNFFRAKINKSCFSSSLFYFRFHAS